GLNLPTRDYARFGQMFLQMGEWNGAQIVPIDWVAASTEPSAPTAAGREQYGLQWWMAPDAPTGEYYARGIYGQYIYINRAAGVVIAANGADRNFRAQGANMQNIEMFRRIAAAL
ncbi:MAG: 6-aminohexanoate hydrolase, partial [Roseinatronobacter sp.]